MSLAREKPFQHLTNDQVIQNAEHMYYGAELQVRFLIFLSIILSLFYLDTSSLFPLYLELIVLEYKRKCWKVSFIRINELNKPLSSS